VTDRRGIGGTSQADDPLRALLRRIDQAVAAGIDWVQIRETDLEGRELLGLVREAVRAAKPSPARVIVNDRLDLALAADAAGVHLGGQSLPAREVVRFCREQDVPAGFLVGVSCHTIEQAREAEGAGASYVFFGPVFDTPSKRPFGPPQGLAKLAAVCRATAIPVIAIGGINRANAAECFRAGSAGVAAIRLFQDATELRQTIGQLHAAGRAGNETKR
jgi:thiamine-phosphate pyrophosphorylase